MNTLLALLLALLLAATPRSAAESAIPIAETAVGPALSSRPPTAAPLTPLAAAPLHAPSRFHRVYPPATQHARDWLWRGLGDTQFACLDSLWHYESGWRVKAGSLTGSYGIPQAYPAAKMASAGADWRTNPMTQVRWGLRFVHARYGSPCEAWAFWREHRWY